MSSSRASANAKLLQRHQRRSSFSGAKASGNKFTEKQSHFERRREEEHVRMMQQASGNQTLQDGSSSSSGAAGRTAGDAMVGSRRDAWRGTGGGVQAGSEDAPSPFALHQQRKRSGHVPIGAGSTAMSTVGGSTFGMPTPMSHATRSQRRTSRFNLSEKPEGGAAAGGGGGEEATGMSGLLGTAMAPWESAEGGTDEEQPGQKRTREERFHDIVSNSKMHRVQQQRERAGREEETKALDKEIDGLLHLLTPRDKIKEEHDAFMRSGTPHVRHLLKEIKKKDGYEARQLRVRANGDFSLTSLAGKPIASGANESHSSPSPLTRQQKAALLKSSKPADVAEVLDEAGRRLLAKIRKGQKAPEELAPTNEDAPEEDDVDALQGDDEEEESEESIAPAELDDDFDKMLNMMSLDPRRARATDRTLDEAEEAELAAQQALLEADRSAIPSLGLAEQDRVMLTRSEWMEQGGDRAMHMDAEEEGNVYDDNVDIPSSYEGDSDADEREADGEDEEENGAEAPSSRTPASTSAVLDQLMSELEKIARSSVPQTASSSSSDAEVAEAHRQRRQHLHKIITQLHAYAGHHVLQVAELFRLVLIEAERTFLRHKRGILNSSLLLHLYVLSKIFPMSDHRHQVTTPFLIFLCSTLMQARLATLHDVHAYLVLAGLLLNSMRSGGQSTGRFCAELVVAPLNVLLLQVPKHIVEPAKYQGLKVPIPLVDRSDAAVLAPPGGPASSSSSSSSPSNTGAGGKRSGASQPSNEEDPTQAIPSTASVNASCTVDLLQTDHFEAEHLLLAAYHLLSNVVDLYSAMPALPAAVLEPFHFFERLIAEHDTEASEDSAWTWQPTPAVRAAHTALAHKLTEAVASVEEHRTPLAMRYFRPRPLRLFEPLLAEQEANAVKTEIRTMKRDIREDKKRVMRHLTAEATVQRRAKDKESALDEAQREKRYNQVLGQLQAQQHTMKTVDAMMSKAKSKQRKSISGLPTAPGGGGDDAE